MKLSYGDIKINENLLIRQGTITINNEEMILIKGKNGVGKSLFLKKLFDNALEMGVNVVLVEQSYDQLFESASILHNISMTTDCARNSYIEKKLEQFGLEYLLKHKVTELSGGEKRLIVLLRGLLSDSELMLVDEPTNDLDYLMVTKLCKVLETVLHDKKVVIVTHDDRLDYLSRKIIVIENNTLKTVFENPVSTFSKEKEYGTKKICRCFIKHRFDTKIFAIVTHVLICVIGLFCCLAISYTSTEKVEPINEGQIDIFIPISDFSDSLMEGAVPSDMVKLWSEKWNFSDLMVYIKNINKTYSDDAISFCLDLNETSIYTPYPIEYKDVINRNSIFTLESMCKEYYNSSRDCFVDTSMYFTIPSFQKGTVAIEFTPHTFFEFINGYNFQEENSNHEIVYTVITLKDGNTFYDFINCKEIQEILSGNYYIRSNETISFINTANKIYSYMNSFLIFIAFVVIIICLELIYTTIFMKAHSKHVLAFKNYGYQIDEILEQILIVTSSKKHKILVCFFIFLVSTIRIITHIQSANIADYSLFLTSSLCLPISYYLGNKIKKINILRIMEWKYRW